MSATVADARSLTRDEVAKAAGTTPEVVKSWTGDAIPPDYFFADGDRLYRYHPATVALFVLAQDLAQYVGPKSALLKNAIRQVGSDLVRAWSDARPRALVIRCGEDLEIRLVRLSCIERARRQVASL